jgi:hypothetical protein
MDLLIKNKHYTLACVWLFFLYSCNTNNTNYLEIRKDSISSNLIKTDLYNSEWHFGFHHFSLKNGKIYIGYLLNGSVLRIVNANDSAENKDIEFVDEALGLYSNNSSLYLILPNKINEYTFNDDLNFQEKTYNTKFIFNDSLIIYPYVSSGIISVGNNKILVPYRVENDNTNMIDSFVYLQMIKKEDSFIVENRIIQHPTIYQSEFEYLKLPICEYSKVNNSLYYTFQKTAKFYKLNLTSKSLDSVSLSDYQTVEFNTKSKQDISYIRKYLQKNDYTTKILIDDMSNIYVLKSCVFKGEQHYELIIFDSHLKILTRKILSDLIIPEISFIYNNKFYVKNSNNNYLIYSINN